MLDLKQLKESLNDIDNVSDGYHTFKDLYYHRMILFSVICNTYKKKSWKSKLHHDGTMYPDYFIVGITTPEGNYTYHYNLEFWDYFDVKELEKAPEWDGHKPEDITRLLSLKKSKMTCYMNLGELNLDKMDYNKIYRALEENCQKLISNENFNVLSSNNINIGSKNELDRPPINNAAINGWDEKNINNRGLNDWNGWKH